VSEQFLNVYLKLQGTAQLFHHGSMGHWQRPVTHPKMVTHLTHGPLTHWPISISGTSIIYSYYRKSYIEHTQKRRER